MTVFFSRFSRHFVQSSQKMRKTAFFEHFARCPAKSVRKHCFFSRLSRHFVQCSLKIRKKMMFSELMRDFSQKVFEKTVFFSRLSRHFVQCSLKMSKKNYVLLIVLCATFHKKCEKIMFFFHVFRGTLCKNFTKNAKKQRFLSFLHDVT